MIVVGSAVQPHRITNLDLILPNLLPSVDKIFLHINGNGNISKWKNHPKINISQSTVNMGDQMKFTGMGYAKSNNAYYFSIDDDILYPTDYVTKIVKRIDVAQRQVITSVHGALFNPIIPEAFNTRKIYHFKSRLTRDINILLPGTGTVAFHTSYFSIEPSDCLHSNMADVWVMCKAALENKKIICLARQQKWLNDLDNHGTAIYKNKPITHIKETLINHKDSLVRYYNSRFNNV